jgi:hypothetical protein
VNCERFLFKKKDTLPEPSLAIVIKEILGRFLWHGVVLLGNIAAT